LDRSLVLLRRPATLERAEVSPLARAGILLGRIQSISTGLEFPDHRGVFYHSLAASNSAAVAAISNGTHAAEPRPGNLALPSQPKEGFVTGDGDVHKILPVTVGNRISQRGPGRRRRERG